MRKAIPIAMTCLYLAAGCSNASNDALAIVTNAPRYSWVSVGTPAAASQAESVLRSQWKNGASLDYLGRSFHNATPAGRAYILCALSLARPAQFNELLEETKDLDKILVPTLKGDVASLVPLNGIIQQIKSNRCDGLQWK
ncbi:MAG: hypothetical protein QM788_01835 [Roseateles sp.]|uniref:hypothetical protein n=1 Tax=Roseateles sp. TaxID=1971397 RepID=UPI0039EBE270